MKRFTKYLALFLTGSLAALTACGPEMNEVDVQNNPVINSTTLSPMADESGRGYFERWELLNAYTGCMLGNPALSVLADAYAKGIRGSDVEKKPPARSVADGLDIPRREECRRRGKMRLQKRGDRAAHFRRVRNVFFDAHVGAEALRRIFLRHGSRMRLILVRIGHVGAQTERRRRPRDDDAGKDGPQQPRGRVDLL